MDNNTGGNEGELNKHGNKYGDWPVEVMFAIYIIIGISCGMLETIRRVAPRSIVGDDINKLRQLDALVCLHLLYFHFAISTYN